MSESEFPNPDKPRPERKHVSARVPESVAKGVFCSGVVVMGSASEVVLDFVQTLVRPTELVARVVWSRANIPRLVAALKQDLEKHAARFAEPVEEQAPEEANGQSVKEPESDEDQGDDDHGEKVVAGRSGTSRSTEAKPEAKIKTVTGSAEASGIYDDFRFQDEVLIGTFANGAMINHTKHEFKIDFLSSFQPYPVVVARVFLTEPQARRLLMSLEENDRKRSGG